MSNAIYYKDVFLNVNKSNNSKSFKSRKSNSVSPSPKLYGGTPIHEPTALEREQATPSQIRRDENTIIWGEKDDMPLVIIKAVDESPTATACLEITENFIRGDGFTDEALMNHVIDEEGHTLYELHCHLCKYITLLDGFSVNFKYNANGKITNAYCINTESLRFVEPGEGNKDIKSIKYNPYFGTVLYQKKYTKEYPLFCLEDALNQMEEMGNDYPGQVYFYGAQRPLYKFYPMPKYWSGNKWIYVDGQIQVFHKENLNNGFFQSVLMNVIGDPDQMSKHPDYQREETGTDGVKRKIPTKTNGQVFDIMMSRMFSGVKKAGSVMALWAMNGDQSAKIQPFPVNTSFDVLSGTFTDAIRGITIATDTPAILANLPQQASSLGSDGNAMRMAIELKQSRIVSKQAILEQFYNNVLLPNLENATSARVKIKRFIPVTDPVTIDKQFWDVLPTFVKMQFIKDNVPGVNIPDDLTIRPVTAPALPGQDPAQPIQAPAPNDVISGLSAAQQDKLFRIIAKYNNGKINFNMAHTLLSSGYNFTDAQINKVLGVNDTEAL